MEIELISNPGFSTGGARWQFRVTEDNKLLLSSQTYYHKETVLAVIDLLKEGLSTAVVKEVEVK